MTFIGYILSLYNLHLVSSVPVLVGLFVKSMVYFTLFSSSVRVLSGCFVKQVAYLKTIFI